MIYLPLLNECLQGCFTTHKGTTIGKNVLSLAVNYAGIQGNSNLNSVFKLWNE